MILYEEIAWREPATAFALWQNGPYLAWLHTTAQQCQQMGSSAQAAAAAFELAHRTVVVPLQVSANRTRLAELLATNWFGTNLPAIGATDPQILRRLQAGEPAEIVGIAALALRRPLDIAAQEMVHPPLLNAARASAAAGGPG